MNSKQSGRRRFLKNGAALAGVAVGAVRSASGQAPRSKISGVPPENLYANAEGYGVRSRYVTTLRVAQQTPLQDSMGIITPSGLHWISGTGRYEWRGTSSLPDIDPRQHHLLIHGLVDRPLIFTMEELKRLPPTSRIHYLECVGNGAGNSAHNINLQNKGNVGETDGQTACSEWTGVLLSLLLRQAGVQKGASWLVAEGADPVKHTRSIPLEKAMDDILVAYGQNGEPVRPEQGYPLRLVVPGWEGNTSVKWLRRIKVVDQPYMTKSESAGYPSLRPDGKGRWFQFVMPPKSIITFPSGTQQLPGRGFYGITGLAWSGGGAIRRVEVSTDGGRSWNDAQLQEPVHRIAHTRFVFPWNWDGEEAVLSSRCTDELGQVQPTIREFSKIWGVNLDYWQTTKNYINHFNPIRSWKVTREGSVQNALFD